MGLSCLAHLARDVACALNGDDEALALGFKLWLGSAFALARTVITLAASTVASRRRALERRLDDLLARVTSCDLARAVQDKIRRARGQLLTFTLFPGQVEPTNNACERDLRPAVVQRKITNGYRSTRSAEGEAAVRICPDQKTLLRRYFDHFADIGYLHRPSDRAPFRRAG